VRAWRRGERRKALVFGSGVVLYGGTILFFSVGILWGLIALPVVISFSVLFVVAGMVYELNYDMQSAAILSKKLVERETTLSETLKHLNLSAAAANVGMWTRKAGEEVVWLSEKGLEIWELTGERQYTLEDLMERIYPDDRQIIIAAGEDFENGNSEFVSEFRIVRRNGKLRWVETRGKVELINGVRTVRGAVVNINKRKLAEEAARRNEEQNTAIVTAIPDMIFLQDSDGVYLGFHAHEKENLLSSPEEFIGKNMRDVLPPALAGEFLVSFERAANGHGPQIVEYKLNHNHEDKWYEARIVWTGNIFLSVVRDITRLKLASEAVYDLSHRLLDAQEKERARLARELHDDLGQSLALLSIQLSQLNEDVGDASAARHVIEHLVSEISLLAAHVHRISHELHPAILQQLGLVPALRGICRELTAAHHNLKIDFESENITSKIPNDVSLCLYRVAQETLQNVVKHSCATSAQVNLKMESGKLLLSISDNGVGFDMNDRKIKQSLGLISIQERVHAVKGAVKIVSEPGNGTKIEASAPINRRG
jgi:signal transduction histidine kinase